MDDDFEMYDEEEYNSKFSSNNDVQNENINSYQNSGLESEIYTGANNQNDYDEKGYTGGQNINEFLNQNYSSLGTKDEDIISSDDDYNISQNQNNMLGSQIVNEFLNKNKEEDSSLTPMYEEQSNISYEDELKTATPIDNQKSDDIPTSPINNGFENVVDEDNNKESNRFINNNDFMSYDPMLQNGLETDGDYVISTFDSNQNNDYVPEKTSFDTEGVMESYKEENVEPELKIEPKEQVEPEVYNTSGMINYEENNMDMFNNSPLREMKVNNKFIFTDINNGEANNRPIPQIEDMPNTVGAIPIYESPEINDKDTKDKNASKKAFEMVATVIFFALLILIVSFFPEINKFFNNLIK